MKWLAIWILFLIALSGPTDRQFRDLTSQVENLERQKCTMMVVLTPNGQVTVCVQKFQ